MTKLKLHSERSNVKQNIVNVVHFNPGFTSADFYENDDNTITKQALVFIEGEQTDSKGRRHKFTPERLEQIADNTNVYLTQSRLPLIKDHNKLQDSVIGDVTGEFEVRKITVDDLPNKKLKQLLGKVGLFCNEVVIKSASAVNQAREGLLSSISAGLDLMTDTIKEVSAVAIPAIPGAALFQGHAYSFDDLEQSNTDEDQIRQQIEELSDKFITIALNIVNADEEDLDGNDPKDLLYQTLEDYESRILAVFDLDDQEPQEQELQTEGQQPTYSGGDSLSAFSMSEMLTLHQNNAEFFRFPWQERPKSLGEKVGGTLGTVAKVGVGLAALKYGGSGALKAGRSLLAGNGVKSSLLQGVRRSKQLVAKDLSRTGRFLRPESKTTGIRNAVADKFQSASSYLNKVKVPKVPKSPKP